MKKNLFVIINIYVMAFVGSLLFTNCKTPRMVSSNKLIGTSWQMTDRVIGLDSAPTITFNYTLNFIDANNAQLIEHEEYSGVSGTYVKNDGSVDYTPGHFEDKKKEGTYSVNGNVITIQFEKDENDRFDNGEPKVYRFRGSYLIYSLDEKEYDELEEFRRNYYTYKRK